MLYNIYDCVFCYHLCHGNAVKGFWALLSSVSMFVDDHLMLSDFGPLRIIFMTCVML
jgi:hypothetical protein